MYDTTSGTTWTGNTYTITTTWDSTSAASRPVVWNGGEVYLGPVAAPAIEEPETALAWLRRRVEEMRVDLAEAA